MSQCATAGRVGEEEKKGVRCSEDVRGVILEQGPAKHVWGGGERKKKVHGKVFADSTLCFHDVGPRPSSDLKETPDGF